MNHQQIMSNYEQPNTPLMNEKLPGIDKLPKLEENSTPSPPAPSCSIVDNRGTMIPSSAYLPPPPPPSYSAFNPGMMYQQHMSPPLTPAVSPSSVLFDSMQFKRKFSVDIGPFGFGTNIPHPSSMHDQDAYRRSSCSAVSMDNDCVQQNEHHGSNAYSTAANAAASVRCQQQQQQQSDYSFLTSMQHHQHHSFGNPTMTTGTAATSPTSSTANASSTSPAGAKPSAASRRGSRAQLSGPNTQHKHACSYPYCTWSFKRYEHLKRHMLVHTGKRPHVCHFPGCGKSFSRSDNFHAHYRTHTKKTNMLQQGGSKKKGGNNNNSSKNNNNQAASVSAAAAAVVAAAAAASVSSSNASMPSQQVFDDGTPAYFAKQQQPPAFDMMDMYGHRHSYSEQVCAHILVIKNGIDFNHTLNHTRTIPASISSIIITNNSNNICVIIILTNSININSISFIKIPQLHLMVVFRLYSIMSTKTMHSITPRAQCAHLLPPPVP